MNDLTLTRPREENTCSAGLGWLATCREGWEFLQQEGWWDGGMEEVEKEQEEEAEEEEPGLHVSILPWYQLEQDVGILSFYQT